MALVDSSGVGVGDVARQRPAILLRSEIRGVVVTARWEQGTLTGDEELVRRVTNLAVWRRLDLDDLEPAQVINLAREACAAPIHTELLLPSDRRVSDRAGDPRAPAAHPPRKT